MALKELVSEMHDLISDVVESTDLLYAALINNSVKAIDEANGMLKRVKDRSAALAGELAREKEKDSNAAAYVSVPSHIQVLGEGMERIAASILKRAEEKVLLTDRALDELDYMFERIRDILVHCRDMVLARNTLVARHLEESDKAIIRSANEYATRHEERLIGGLCMPKASSIYLEMLDAFKEIASNAKDVGKDLAG
jgi:Na+/phosphate symporter